MANRHKMFKKGGGISKAEKTSGNEDVIREAKERKDGGEVGSVVGKATGGRLDRKRGGKCMSSGGKSPFSSAGGGKADKSPFSGAKMG